MRIDFEDGGYIEIKKSQQEFDKIFIIIGTRESPLKMNTNIASLTRAEFATLAGPVLSTEYLKDKEHENSNEIEDPKS